MVRSKRAKFVPHHLRKKTRDDKEVQLDTIKGAVEKYPNIFVFRILNMRNIFLQKFRDAFRANSDIIMSKNTLLRKALGATPEEEMKDNLHLLCPKLTGNDLGLMFSESSLENVQDYVKTASEADYARAGQIATEDVVIPEGAIQVNGENMSHTLESQLREGGMACRLKKGVLYLDANYTICRKGDILTAEQCKLLKLFYIQMSHFQILLLAAYQNGKVVSLQDDEDMKKGN